MAWRCFGALGAAGTAFDAAAIVEVMPDSQARIRILLGAEMPTRLGSTFYASAAPNWLRDVEPV